RMSQELLDVAPRAGEKIVHAENGGAEPDQPLAKVRPEESSSACNQHTLLEMHYAPQRFVTARRTPPSPGATAISLIPGGRRRNRLGPRLSPRTFSGQI